MLLLNLSLDTAAENLALDEALLEDAPRIDADVLRIWEANAPCVVLGRSSLVNLEVDVERCRAENVLIQRRDSGGASVLIGPGCLMYSLVLAFSRHPQLRHVGNAHRFVLETLSDALARCLPGVAWQGTSDLTFDGKKFSGNSLRCRRDALVYHGTLLYDFPLPRIGELLKRPPREPEYRAGRAHDGFVINLPLPRATLVTALIDTWSAHEKLSEWPSMRTLELSETKYADPRWNFEGLAVR